MENGLQAHQYSRQEAEQITSRHDTVLAVAPPKIDQAGCSALHYAALAGDGPICRKLLDAGVNTEQRDQNGRTAADYARSAGHFELAALIEKREETADELAARAQLTMREVIGLVNDNIDTVKTLISSGRLSARDAKGDTPLHIIARRGKLAFADLAIQAGADIYALNHAGQTPATCAKNSNFSMLADLIESLEGPPLPLESMAGTKPPLSETPSHLASPVTPQPWMEQLPANGSDLALSPVFSSAELDFDSALFDDFTFEAVVEAEDFHLETNRNETRADFQRILVHSPVLASETEHSFTFDIAPFNGDISGEAISSSNEPETSDFEPAFISRRRELRRRVQPSLWRRFRIDIDGCQAIIQAILVRGHVVEDDISEILGLCSGRFDPVDLRLNIIRELEVAGFELDQNPEDLLWDTPCVIDAEELCHAIVTTCSRNSLLPGSVGHVPEKHELSSLTEGFATTKWTLLRDLAENAKCIEIILYMIDRVLGGDVASEEICSLTFDPKHPNDEGRLFIDARESLLQYCTGITAGSSRAVRSAAAALAQLDLKPEFLGDLAQEMRAADALTDTALRLEKNLNAYESASRAFIMAFLPLCRRYAAQNSGEAEDQEDVFQQCFFGLRRAVMRFAPELSANFIAYASTWLRQSLLRWRADHERSIRIPIHRQNILSEVKRAADTLEPRLLREATTREIVQELRLSPGQATTLAALPLYPVELDWLDAQPEAGPDIPISFEQADIAKLLTQEMNLLDTRHRDIVRRRFGIGFEDEMTLEEIGALYGLTRERIRQIEAQALNFLRHPGRRRLLAKAL